MLFNVLTLLLATNTMVDVPVHLVLPATIAPSQVSVLSFCGIGKTRDENWCRSLVGSFEVDRVERGGTKSLAETITVVIIAVMLTPLLSQFMQTPPNSSVLVCGALSDGRDRPQRKEDEKCQCKDGWGGINCNGKGNGSFSRPLLLL